ncbi:MAG: ABC transporter ATP-binding protein/permease [Clostridioides sp.]|nr:ABC transporter ATP-binding protein/permease [Clostridioides sp.]
MKLMLKYLYKYKIQIMLSFAGALSFALVELGIPTVMSLIIDNGIIKNDTRYVINALIVMIGISIFGGIGSMLLGYCSSKVSTGVAMDIRNDIFEKSQEFSHVEYDKFGVSTMIVRTTNDVYQLQLFTNVLLRTAMVTPVMFLVSIIMTIVIDIQLSFVIMCTIPLIILGVYVIAIVTGKISERQQLSLDKLNRILRENITGIRVIRAFRKDDYESKRFHETNQDYTRLSKKLFMIMSATQPSFLLILDAAVAIVLYISSVKVGYQGIQIGQIVAFLEYLFHAMFSIMLFSMVFVMYPKAAISAKRIDEIFKEEPKIVDSFEEKNIFEKTYRNNDNDSNKKTSENENIIEFENVCFSYFGSDKEILKNISFTVKKGERVAIIGSTGSGKTSIVNLIPRLYDVTRGSVKINGKDVREYNLKKLRQKISFVPQKSRLFSGTIRENLKFGNKNATDKELEYFAKASQAYDFINRKEENFDFKLSEGGTNLSGGQKQRISIARALAKKSEIYIFDDSFSALDYKTDAVIRKRLKEELKDCAVLTVAQRISSIKDSDKIIVIESGEIKAEGKHKDLLQKSSLYREIVTSQMREEEFEIE